MQPASGEDRARNEDDWECPFSHRPARCLEVKPTVVCGAHPGPPYGLASLVPQSRPSMLTKTCAAFAQMVNCRPGSFITEAHKPGRVKRRRVDSRGLEQHGDGARAVQPVICVTGYELVGGVVTVGAVARTRGGDVPAAIAVGNVSGGYLVRDRHEPRQ